jgi:alpha-amylase
LNRDCHIYQEIAKIAAVMRSREPLRFGRMYYRQISEKSDNGFDFRFPPSGSTEYTLAFSRILFPREVLIAYHVSGHARNDCIVIDAEFHRDGDTLEFLYGKVGNTQARTAPDGTRFVQIDLAPHQFVILE